MSLRGNVFQTVFKPAVTLKPTPTSQKRNREKDPFFKNYRRGAQMILRRKAVAV